MNVEAVAAIFGRVLELGEVGADSDFFALGGDSLLATRVLSAVARTYGVELSFDDFAVAPTPSALAKKIQTRSGGNNEGDQPPSPQPRTAAGYAARGNPPRSSGNNEGDQPPSPQPRTAAGYAARGIGSK